MDKKRLTCVINIGHQPNKPGAKNLLYNLSEFDFNRKLALRIEILTKKVTVKTIYQRTLNSLPDYINSLEPDFFVSLHCNAHTSPHASGTEVLYLENSEKGKAMAEILLKRLVNCLGLPNRGIKSLETYMRGFFLLKNSFPPGAICEPFFISNDEDLGVAISMIDSLALAYARAMDEIADYFIEAIKSC